jgi:lactam utilization protein B
MSRNSRSYTGAALVVAWMAIPAVVHAQRTVAERSLMNQAGSELRSEIGAQQPVETDGVGDHSQGSRALLGTVDAIRLDVSEPGVTDYGFPTAEQALLGRSAAANLRRES